MLCQFSISKPPRTEGSKPSTSYERLKFSLYYRCMAQKYKTVRIAGQHSRSFYGKSNPWNHWWAVRSQAGPLQPTTSILSVLCGVGRPQLPTSPPAEKEEYPLIFFSEVKADSVTHCKATAISDNLRTRTSWEQKQPSHRLGWSTCPNKQELGLSYTDRDSNSVFLKQSESLTHFKGLRQSFAG